MDEFLAEKIQAERRQAALEGLFEAAPVGLCAVDLEYRYVVVNETFARMYHLPVESFPGRTVEEVLPAVGDQIIAHLHECLVEGKAMEREITLPNPSGAGDTLVYLRAARPLRDAAGKITGFCAALLDITERKRIEAALRESEEHHRYTVELTPHIPWTTDPQGKSEFVSAAWQELTGVTPEELRDRGVFWMVHPDDREMARTRWQHSLDTGTPYDLDYRIRVKNDDWRWMRVRAFPRLGDQGEIIRWYGTLEDIHDRKLVEEALVHRTDRLQEATHQLERLSQQDYLTGLANRRRFDKVIDREIRAARRSGLPLSLVMIDLDDFKRYNDTYGHPAGDECLRAVARVISSVLRRPGDTGARYGGEEFAMVLPNTSLAGAALLAEKVREGVRALDMVHRNGRSGVVTISAGVATREEAANTHTTLTDALVLAADHALYEAKSEGRDRVVQATGWLERAPGWTATGGS